MTDRWVALLYNYISIRYEHRLSCLMKLAYVLAPCMGDADTGDRIISWTWKHSLHLIQVHVG